MKRNITKRNSEALIFISIEADHEEHSEKNVMFMFHNQTAE
jgi:hypothetical protein